MQLSKRIFALVLALTLVLGNMPWFAAATDWNETNPLTQNITTAGPDVSKKPELSLSDTITQTFDANNHQHSIVRVVAKAPTCTTVGWNSYEYCETCDYTTYTERAATGHNYVNCVCVKCGDELLVTDLVIKTLPTKTEYLVGERLNLTGLTLTATYVNGSSRVISQGYTTTGFDSDSSGIQTVTVAYNGATTSFEVSVEQLEINENSPQIVFESKRVARGNTFTVTAHIKNNPGFAYLEVTPVFSPELKLLSVENGTLISDFTSAIQCIWVADDNVTDDGLLLTLTFATDASIAPGEYQVDFLIRNCLKVNEVDAAIYTVKGNVEVINCVYGETEGHNFSSVVTEATCSTQGYTTHTCSVCGYVHTDSIVAALGHSMSQWTVTKEATCAADGSRNRSCSRCGYFETEVIPAIAHAYTSIVTAPTCAAQGYTTHTCSVCGNSYTDSFVAPKAHNMGPWVAIEAASCSSDGRQRRDCARCDYFETRVVYALGHKYVNGVCGVCGEKLAVASISIKTVPSKVVYTLGEIFDADGLTLTVTYANGSAQVISRGFSIAGFDSSSAGTKTVTVSYQGATAAFDVTVNQPVIAEDSPQIYMESQKVLRGSSFTVSAYIKNNPGFAYLEVTPIIPSELQLDKIQNGDLISDFTNAIQYIWVADEDVTADGLLLTMTFSVAADAVPGNYPIRFFVRNCLKYNESPATVYATEANIEILSCVYGEMVGHAYTVDVIAPTCTIGGYTSYTCDNCGDTYTDSVVAALGHSMGQWSVTNAPGCTNAGSQRRECARCDYFEEEVISAIGHSYTSKVTAPTCTAEGFTTHTCGNCGDSYTDSVVSALGHSMGQWGVTNAPGCTNAGSQRRDCARCDYFEEDVITAIGHSYTSKVTAPTCTAEGFTTHTCGNCGDSYTDSVVSALGHSVGQWVEINAPDCTNAGSQRRDCARCDYFEEEMISATGHNYVDGICGHCGDELVVTGIQIRTNPIKTEYIVGEMLDTAGLTLEVTYSNGSTQVISQGFSTTGFESAGIGKSLVQVSYKGAVTSFEVTINRPVITEDTPQIFIESKQVVRGGKFTVSAYIKNNPGFAYLEVTPVIPSELHLEKVQNGKLISDFTKAIQYIWVADKDVTEDGLLLTLSFAVDADVVPGEYKIDFIVRNCIKYDETPATIYVAESCIEVLNCVYGNKEGHVLSSEITAPTCTADGYTTHICSACGEIFTDTIVEALGHNMGQWAQTKAATCTEEGGQRRDCARCDYFEDETIAATGHSYTSKVTAPTCTDKGFTTHTCSNCGDTYQDSFVDAWGHEYINRICDHCGEKLAVVSIAVNSGPDQTEYIVGDSLDITGLVLSVTYANGTVEEITEGFAVTGFDSLTSGTKTLTVTYENCTDTFDVTVRYAPVAEDAFQIFLESKQIASDSTFTVSAYIKNNPGFAYLELTPVIPEGLMLVDVQNGNLISDFTKGNQYIWIADKDMTSDGLLMTFTLKVTEAAEGSTYPVDFLVRLCSNYQYEILHPIVVHSNLEIVGFLRGDANGDGIVNGVDILRLKRYFADFDYATGESSETIFPGADANGDGQISGMDVLRLKRYFADFDYDSGTSPIDLGPA